MIIEKTNTQPRIGLFDTTFDVLVKMSDGNPGAMNVIMQLIKRGKAADIEAILLFDLLGIYGSQIYQLWNDCCNRDIDRVLKVVEAIRNGTITREVVMEHIDQHWGIPFTDDELGIKKGAGDETI